VLLKAENIAADYGSDAAHQGESRDTNPYPTCHFLHKWWDFGIDHQTKSNCEIKMLEGNVSDYNEIFENDTSAFIEADKALKAAYAALKNAIEPTFREMISRNDVVSLRELIDIVPCPVYRAILTDIMNHLK